MTTLVLDIPGYPYPIKINSEENNKSVEGLEKSQEAGVILFGTLLAVTALILYMLVTGLKTGIKDHKTAKLLRDKLVPVAEEFRKKYQNYINTLNLIRTKKIVERIKTTYHSKYLHLKDFTENDIKTEKEFIRQLTETLIDYFIQRDSKKKRSSDVELSWVGHTIIFGYLDVIQLTKDIEKSGRDSEKEYANIFLEEVDKFENILKKELKPAIKQIDNEFDYNLFEIPGDDGEINISIEIPYTIPAGLYNELLDIKNRK